MREATRTGSAGPRRRADGAWTRPNIRERILVSMFRCTGLFLLLLAAASGQEALYNGIHLPKAWPPRDVKLTNEPIPEPPYLVDPPSVIPVDVGRQLFVDDFLIEQTDLKRTFHRP